MTTLIVVLILVGAMIGVTICIMMFTYPELLVRAVKFLFVKPVKAMIRARSHKPAAQAVQGGDSAPDALKIK